MNEKLYRNSHHLQAQAEALVSFLEAFTKFDTLSDIGPALTCLECEAMANLLHFFDEEEAARVLRKAHVESDDEGDLREHVELKQQLAQALAASVPQKLRNED